MRPRARRAMVQAQRKVEQQHRMVMKRRKKIDAFINENNLKDVTVF